MSAQPPFPTGHLSLLRDRQAWLQSARTFAAAMVALYIALAAGLASPYWAMGTAYIVTQPMLGPTRSKGIHRVLGTLAAGLVTLWALPQLVETPWLHSAAMSLWLSLCLLIALLNRSPRGYAFMLAGYSVAIMSMPSLANPEAVFDTVVARSEEILLGTVVAVLFAALLFPVPARPMVRARLRGWMDDAAHWSSQVLAGGRGRGPRNRLAADLVQFQILIDSVRRDDPRHARSASSMRHLREHLLMLLPVLASIADRIGALRSGGRPLPAGLEALVQDIGAWLQPAARDPAGGDALRARIQQLRPGIDGDYDHLQLITLLLRLEELVDIWQDCGELQAAIDQGRAPHQPQHFRIRRHRGRPRRHVDWGMALFSASSAGMALMAYCTLWILIGWEGGGNGAMMAAIVASFFAGQDDPAPGILVFLISEVVAAAIAFALLFGVLPAVQDFASLTMVLALVFVPVGLLVQRPRTAMIGITMMINLSAQLSIQHAYSANLQRFVNSTVSMILGIGFALLMTRLFRSVGAEWSARRLVRQGWSTLAAAAEGRGEQDHRRFAARMLDLLGLLAPRLAATPPGSNIAPVDMLGEARVGLNILQLRGALAGLPPEGARAIAGILAQLAGHYRRQAALQQPLPPPEALQAELETLLRQMQTLPAGKHRDDALIGALGLHCILFAGPGTPDTGAATGETADALTAAV